MSPVLDHLVLAVPDLEEAVRELGRRAGVEPLPGGSHPGMGTRNALLGLTWRGGRRHYLELISRDPVQPDVPDERLMLDLASSLPGGSGGVAEQDGAARMHAWAVRLEGAELDDTLGRARAAGIEVGEAVAAERQTPDGATLSWRLAVPRPLGLGGVQPFLIDWRGGAHPTDADLPTVELVSLELLHPEPDHAAEVLRTLGVDLPVGRADTPGLRAVLSTPGGEIELT